MYSNIYKAIKITMVSLLMAIYTDGMAQGIIAPPTTPTTPTNQQSTKPQQTKPKPTQQNSKTSEADKHYLTVNGESGKITKYVEANSTVLNLRINTNAYSHQLHISHLPTWMEVIQLTPTWLDLRIYQNFASYARSEKIVLSDDFRNSVTIQIDQSGAKQGTNSSNSYTSNTKSSQSTYSQPNNTNNYSRSNYSYNRYTPVKSKSEYPLKDFYFDIGGVSFFNPISFGCGFSFGFNFNAFNFQLGISHGWDIKEYETGNTSTAGEILVGWNFVKDNWCKLALQGGIGISDGGLVRRNGYYDKDGFVGGVIGLRSDMVLCKHISFYMNPMATIGNGFNGRFTTGFSFYF